MGENIGFKIVFAGTPSFSAQILQSLIESESKHSIIAVLTQPDRPAGRGQALTQSPVKQLALQNHVPVHQPMSLKTSEAASLLQSLQPDILVVAAYGLILPKNILSIPKYGCLNVHTSLLPRWRGAAPIQHAILSGDTETGVSIMQMNEGLDTGDILLTEKCLIKITDTSDSLTQELTLLGAKTLLNALEKLPDLKATPQDNTKATYAPKITKTDATLSWQETTTTLDRKIRAFNPWPVGFTTLQDQTIRIWKAVPLAVDSHQTAGTIIQANAAGIDVATGQGTLRLLEIQMPGKKRMSVKDSLNAKDSPFYPGNIFR